MKRSTNGTRATLAELQAARVKMLGEHAKDPVEKEGYFRLEQEYRKSSKRFNALATWEKRKRSAK